MQFGSLEKILISSPGIYVNLDPILWVMGFFDERHWQTQYLIFFIEVYIGFW